MSKMAQPGKGRRDPCSFIHFTAFTRKLNPSENRQESCPRQNEIRRYFVPAELEGDAPVWISRSCDYPKPMPKKKKKKLLHHLATWWKTSLNWTFQKFTIEFHLSDLGSEWEKGWKGWWRVRVEENFFFFLVRRNRLHSWILCHVINKTKHTAFLPKHMALFLKHRSGLSWNSVFVSILFFLFT